MTSQLPTAEPMSPAVRKGLIVWIVKALLGMPLIGLILFALAGTVHWVDGWVFFILGLLAVSAHFLVLLWANPALLAARSRDLYEQEAPRWDKILVALGAAVFPYASWGVSALDFRFEWTTWMPLALQVAAVVVFVLAWAVILWATVANRFFTTTVHIQPGHRVEDTGPYRFVRHPGYVGAMLYYTVSPLIMGSWWGLIPALLADVCIVWRTVLEDRFLHANLPGYPDYAARVRHRLVPGVW
jgi:protein-S-isoprenylcysteine O-methyltransferase Ste14